MHSADWAELIEVIPADAEDALSLVMNNGWEITVLSIVRTDENFLVVKGRAVGSSTAGQMYFVPFDQIACMVFNRIVKEQVVQAWFDPEAAPAAAASTEEVQEEAAAEVAAETPPEPAKTGPSLPGVPKPAAAGPVKQAPTPGGRPSLPLRLPGAKGHPPAAAAGPVPGIAALQTGNLQPSPGLNPIKSALLDRLRARKAADDAPEPPPADKK